MKKLISITLVFAMLFLMTPFTVFGNETDGLVYELSADGTYYIVDDYTGTATEVVIPLVYEGLPVKEIGVNAFFSCKSIISIEIPNSITTISYGAFRDCENLKNVTIPDSVVTIGRSAFQGCVSLTSIKIPASVTTIPAGTFLRCTDLESLTVDSGNTVYHSSGNCIIETETKTLVHGCKNSVIPSDGSVTTIGECAFCYCTGLTSINIPNTVTKIDSYAFDLCTGLTSVIIPESVITMGESAFSRCFAMTDIYCEAESLPEGWHDEWNYEWEFPCYATIHWGYRAEADIKLGDINVDNDITSFDYILIQRVVMGTYDFSEEQIKAGDIDGNSSIDSSDYILIKRHVMGTYVIGG